MTTRTKTGKEARRAAAALVVTAGVAVAVGSALHLTGTQWLSLGLGTALSVWTGGAVTGQILLARLLDHAWIEEVVGFARELLWLVTRIYVPSSVVAVACGSALVVGHDLSWPSVPVVVPLALYGVTTVLGIAVSKPGFAKVFDLAQQSADHGAEIRSRVAVLAWVNRAELVMVIGIGFAVLAGTIPA